MTIFQRLVNNLKMITNPTMYILNGLFWKFLAICFVFCLYTLYLIQFSFYNVSFVFWFYYFPSYTSLWYPKQLVDGFYSSVFDRNTRMWLQMILRAYIRCFYHCHYISPRKFHVCAYITFSGVLILIWPWKYITYVFHWIHHKIIMFQLTINYLHV